MHEQRDDGGFFGQPTWLWSLAALLVGLSLAIGAAWLHHAALVRSERNLLEHRAERSFDAVETQLRDCGLLVRAVQALFLASDQVTPAEFGSIYSNLRKASSCTNRSWRQIFAESRVAALRRAGCPAQ
jgi:CHASE1-domain containing sensor protein